MKKIIYTLLASAFLLTGLVTLVRADDAPEAKTCKLISEENLLSNFKDVSSAKIITVTPEQVKELSKSMGQPPNTDPDRPFTVFLIVVNDTAKLFVSQDGCITVTAGPAPLEMFLKKMGVSLV